MILIELEIYFEQRSFYVREDGTLTTPIRMRFNKATQSPFTLTVTAVSNENTESLGISSFISDSVTMDNATLGRFSSVLNLVCSYAFFNYQGQTSQQTMSLLQSLLHKLDLLVPMNLNFPTCL